MPEFDLLAFEAGYLDAFTFSKVMEVNNNVNTSLCHALGSKGEKYCIVKHSTQAERQACIISPVTSTTSMAFNSEMIHTYCTQP